MRRPSVPGASPPSRQFVGNRIEIGHAADGGRLANPRRQVARTLIIRLRASQDVAGASLSPDRADEARAGVALQLGKEHVGPDRLGKKIDAARLARGLADFVPGAGRHGNDRNRRGRLVGGEPARRLESTQVGHAQIHEHDIGPVRAAELDGLEPAGGGDHAHARALEQAGENAAVDRTVVGDERRQMFARREARVRRERLAVGVARSPARHRLLGLDERQLEIEAAAFARRALDLQLAAHAAHQPVADGQAQARAAKLGARTRLPKRLKDRAQILGFNPDAGIDDVEPETRPAVPGADDAAAPRPAA